MLAAVHGGLSRLSGDKCMSFRSAGFRPAALGGMIALVFALSASVVMAQDAKPAEAAPANATTAAQKSSAGAPGVDAPPSAPADSGKQARSEERRVGKECRSRSSPSQYKNKTRRSTGM